jgi:hypothetical protein
MRNLIFVALTSSVLCVAGCGSPEPNPTSTPSTDAGSKGVEINGQVEIQPDAPPPPKDGGASSAKSLLIRLDANGGL